MKKKWLFALCALSPPLFFFSKIDLDSYKKEEKLGKVSND